MGKNHRLTDINKWTNGSWFRKLDPEEKLFWYYIHDRCDQSGVWIEDWEEVKFYTSVVYDPGSLLEAFDGKIEYFSESKKWWIKDYCILQHTTFLIEKESNAARRKAVSLMKEHNVYVKYVEHYKASFPGIDIDQK